MIKILKTKTFWSVILFVLVFLIYFLPINDVWFSLDDCGNIVAGIIRSFKDLFRVFTEDERAYLYPINFTIPKPNLVSAFYRPMQHIPFTIIYYLFGFNAQAYYFVNVLFHAINSVLFLYLTSFFVPLFFAVCAALLFAFYPVMDWIIWISTLHNFLAIFFMFLSLIFYRMFWIKQKKYWKYLAGLFFLFSIISRENTIVLGFWLFAAAFIWPEYKTILARLKFVFLKMWAFLLVYLVYFFIRLFAFGFESLPRTLNNLFLKFPILKDFFT